VGLAAIRKKVARLMTAVVSIMVGAVAGLGMERLARSGGTIRDRVLPIAVEDETPKISFGGGVWNLAEIKASILRDQ